MMATVRDYGAAGFRLYFRTVIVMRSMYTDCAGAPSEPPPWLGSEAILRTTSMPEITRRTIACWPFPPGASADCAEADVTMKNWLPAVPAGSRPVLAIATVPTGYFAPSGGTSRVESPAPPEPVP